MKKVLVAILLITYAFALSGASVDLHYCMGKLIGWNFDYTTKKGCRKCGMQTRPDKGCCDNKQINPKIDKEQQAAYNNISLNNDPSAIVPPYSFLNNAVYNATIPTHASIHGPPTLSFVSVYLVNCNFRI